MGFIKKWYKQGLLFLGFQILFIPVFSFLFIYYGPFQNIRGTIVYTAMHTAKHKYLATAFLSKGKIDEIISKYKSSIETKQQHLENIKPLHIGNDEIQIEDVFSGLARGKLMIISDPSRIQLAVSEGLGKTGSTLSQMVQRNGALGGINAGAYINKDNVVRGGAPGGVIIQDGALTFLQRNTGKYCVIGFNSQNILVISTVKGKEAIGNLKLSFGVSFGPALIIDGVPLVKQSGAGLQPRTAIAQRQDGTVLFLALDGRQIASAGATLKDVQDVLLKYGAYNAANLDGGSSTTMFYEDKVINIPSEREREKYIPSAFLVMPYGEKYGKK